MAYLALPYPELSYTSFFRGRNIRGGDEHVLFSLAIWNMSRCEPETCEFPDRRVPVVRSPLKWRVLASRIQCDCEGL